jgi:hypothetical protein
MRDWHFIREEIEYVSAYLDLAEDRAERHIPMTMEDWSKRLDIFLMADDREVLQDSGKITSEIAREKAEKSLLSTTGSCTFFEKVIG